MARLLGLFAAVLGVALGASVVRGADDEPVRAVFVTLGEPGMDAIGPYVNSEALKASFEKLPKDDPVDVIVFRINSTGGLLNEVPRLSDLFEGYKSTSRVVVWVDRALSAAALTSVTSSTIVMSPGGTIGAAVTYTRRAGKTEALTGENLEKALQVGAALAARGKHEPALVRAMQVPEALSCDLGAAGPVNWQASESGSEVVNKAGEVLTLTGEQAVKYGLAAGIADSKDALMKLVGYPAWTEVAPEVDADQQRYRKEVRDADLKVQEGRVRRDEALQKVRTMTTPEDKKAAAKVAGRLDAEISLIFRKYPALREYYGAVADDDVVPPGTPRKIPMSDKPITMPAPTAPKAPSSPSGQPQ